MSNTEEILRANVRELQEQVSRLQARLAEVIAERDAARALNAEWEAKARNWMASPEAAARLLAHSELGKKLNKVEQERDAAMAEIEKLKCIREFSDDELLTMASAATIVATGPEGTTDGKRLLRGFAARVLMAWGSTEGMHKAFLGNVQEATKCEKHRNALACLVDEVRSSGGLCPASACGYGINEVSCCRKDLKDALKTADELLNTPASAGKGE